MTHFVEDDGFKFSLGGDAVEYERRQCEQAREDLERDAKPPTPANDNRKIDQPVREPE